MLIAICAFLALAATAAVVIRDADPNAGARAVTPASDPEPIEQPAEQPAETDAPTQAAVVGFPEVKPLYDPMVDAPTEAMPALVVGAGGQAAAILPYAAPVEPNIVPDPDVTTSPDPDRLIQTVVLLDETAGAHGAAVAKLVAGIAISGGVVGLTLIAVGRAISALLGH
jgi:hypothetical protein